MKTYTNSTKQTKTTTQAKTTPASLVNRITNSKGRFFGLYLKNGETLNAQFRRETPAYLMVFDRTSATVRRVLKTSIVNATV